MEWLEAEEADLDAASALDLLADEDEETDESEPTKPAESPHSAAQRWPALEPAPQLSLTPRPYQEEALAAGGEAVRAADLRRGAPSAGLLLPPHRHGVRGAVPVGADRYPGAGGPPPPRPGAPRRTGRLPPLARRAGPDPAHRELSPGA